MMQQLGNRRFAAFFAKQGHNIEKGGSFRILSPDWMQKVIVSATRAKLAQSGQQQHAISSYGQSGMTGNRLGGTDLCLAHSENIFFITVIYFDLPAIKARLDQQLGFGPQISGQKVSWFTIVGTRMFGELVRNRSNHEQTQLAGASAAL